MNNENFFRRNQRLTQEKMKERSKQQLLAAELVHANQYGQGV